MDETPQQPGWSTDLAAPINPTDSPEIPELTPIQWSASEYIAHQKNTGWYLILGFATVLITVIVMLITWSIMSSLVVAGAALALGVVAARKPEVKNYVLTDEGLGINDRFYPYGSFKSFSVVNEGAIDSIWMRPLKRFTPTTTMYFAPEEEDQIIAMLENFLPEENRSLDLIDRLSQRIRF